MDNEQAPLLDTLDDYRRLFTDVGYWTPFVQVVCREHGLLPAQPVRTGIPGTCPVFIVAERWVVKFFGRLFDGAEAFAAEREAGRLANSAPDIRTARLVAWGELGGAGWPWPYLVFDFIPGISIGEARDQISPEDQLRAARELGETIRRLHALPLAGSAVFPNTYEPYLHFLMEQRAGAAQRQRASDSLPPRLVDQIDSFLPTPETLVDFTRPPHLIHADLTRDHLLGRFENGRWNSLAVIDFGDAMTGDLLYELGALHLDLFGGDQRLLAAFLKAYGLPASQRAELPRKALATALLHRFNLFCAVQVPEDLETLEDLAELLWGAAAA